MAKQIPLSQTMQLSASETRHYGTHDKTFSVSQMFAPENKTEMLKCMTVLNDRLQMFFEDYELNNLKQSARDAAISENYKRLDTLLTWMPIQEIYRKVDGDKSGIRVKTIGEKYAKFGVPCYDEIVRQFDIEGLLNGQNSWKPAPGSKASVLIDASGTKPKATNFENLRE